MPVTKPLSSLHPVGSGTEGDKQQKQVLIITLDLTALGAAGTEALESVPRTVAGVVNDKGEIIDKAGKVIGTVLDVKDHEKLVGDAVTDKGDVVSDLGESLANVHIDENYTPTQVPAQVPEKKDAAAGWNVLGKARTAMQYGDSIRNAVSYGQNLQSAYNRFSQGQKPEADQMGEGVSAAREPAGGEDQIPNPVKMEDKDKPVQEDVGAETQGLKPQDQKGGEAATSAAEDKRAAKPALDEAGEDAGEQIGSLAAQSPRPIPEEGAGDVPESSKETVETASEGQKPLEEVKGVAGDDKLGQGKAAELERGEGQLGGDNLGQDKLEATKPGEDVLSEAKDEVASRGESQLGKDTLGEEKVNETMPGQDTLGEGKDEIAGRGEGRLGEDTLGETKPGEDTLSEAKDQGQLGKHTLGEAKPGEGTVAEDKVQPGEDKLGEYAVGEAQDEATSKTEEGQLGEDKLAETEPDKMALDEDKVQPSESKLGEETLGEAQGEVASKTEEDQLGEGKLDEIELKKRGLDEATGQPSEGALGEETFGEEAAGKTEEGQPGYDELAKTEPDKMALNEATGQPSEGALGEETVGEEATGKPEEGQLGEDQLAETELDKMTLDEGKAEEGQLGEGKLDETEPSTLDEAKDEATDKVGEGAEEAGEAAEKPLDFTVLKGTKVNKAGNLVNDKGDIIGRLVDGDPKQLMGRTADEEGQIWNESGKIIGKAEPISDADRDEAAKEFAPFENFPDAVVEGDGRVMSEGRQVGEVIEGDAKRMKGSRVDEDGDILDRRGNVIGKAKPWDEPEEIPPEVIDMSSLAGKRVNKAGNVVDAHGQIFGRVVEGNVKALVGRMCDKEGNIMSESGEKIGRAELVPESEREGSREGPFAELSGCTVTRDGKVVTPSGDVVGRLISGDGKVLYGRAVDEDGDVVDKNGNVLGTAERWEEPVVEKKKDPLAGRRVNREGNVVDEDGNIIGKLVSGDLNICSGKEIDDDGDVVNSKGMTIGHVSLLEDIPPEPEESAEDKEKREQAEKDRKLAGQLAASIEQSLDKIKPILRMITDKVDRAERTPKEELDEEQLVREVKPLIEEGSKILTETNGVVRGMDPDGRIQRQAKHKASTKDATPEEHHLAEVIKELTGDITQTIDNAKRKIEGMPHAKKELNPLWGLLSEPLFQIIAAVGLLLNGVLSLVGRLLSGLGLGGLVDNLLGTLGLNRVLEGLGLGSVTSALTGKKDKDKKKTTLF
ncbi:DUF3659 domain protein [Metarhizium robertsii]|uniref:DUF3659 domain protein n=1 Tax=Metarhizium robertsii TaxID=568076 RepID=A0A014QWF2_9HYPO|nr:DUF3659 domain protein [Metarhizium robertsii]